MTKFKYWLFVPISVLLLGITLSSSADETKDSSSVFENLRDRISKAWTTIKEERQKTAKESRARHLLFDVDSDLGERGANDLSVEQMRDLIVVLADETQALRARVRKLENSNKPEAKLFQWADSQVQ